MKSQVKVSLEDQLAAARLELNNTGEHLRHIFTNGQALRQLITDRTRQGIFRFQLNSSGTPAKITNGCSHIISEIRSASMVELGSMNTIMSALEADATYKEAVATIGPLLAKIAELEAEIQAAQHAEGLRLQDIENRKREATKAALEAVEAEFATD